jgi:hypothetical protein
MSKGMIDRKPKKQSNEQHYYDVLKHIAKNYQTSEQLRRTAEKDYGLDAEEAIEYAYDNVRWDAERAIKGKRRPKQ